MNSRESPFFWSFPCGSWFLTRVRVSIYFPLLVLVICWNLKDARLGLIFSGILFASVVFHEFGHILAVRWTGGTGNEILIWPMGGLAFVQPAPTFASQLLTPAAGPLVNLALCGITLVSVLDSGSGLAALNPLQFPNVTLLHDVPGDLLRLTFYANWMLFLANLIPVYPLDGGRMLRACLMTRYDGDASAEIYIRIGLIVAFLLMIVGLLANSVWIVFIGAIVLVLNVQESQQIRASESYDESFMGYDFSQGYTSLERSAGSPRERRPGLLERWRQARRAEKLRREQEKTAEAERTVDELLDKVHAGGMESLTVAERRRLQRASARLREKGKERK
jgi:Zn-dependent protease